LTRNITHLLKEWSEGDQRALDELTPLVYEELRQQAARYLRKERPNHSLQATALINEAFLRLIDVKDVQWQNRAHFFAIAAKIMRRILLNYARDQHRQKRGGSAVQVSLSEVATFTLERPEELIALDDALERLTAVDERKSRVVELKYFGGLENEEIAEVLKISAITVMRDWKFAKAWLFREIENGS